MKNRRNLIIYRHKLTGIVGALVISEDKEAEKVFDQIKNDRKFDQVELFGREYDSYELEDASEDC